MADRIGAIRGSGETRCADASGGSSNDAHKTANITQALRTDYRSITAHRCPAFADLPGGLSRRIRDKPAQRGPVAKSVTRGKDIETREFRRARPAFASRAAAFPPQREIIAH